jgi:hypothetical protein
MLTQWEESESSCPVVDDDDDTSSDTSSACDAVLETEEESDATGPAPIAASEAVAAAKKLLRFSMSSVAID